MTTTTVELSCQELVELVTDYLEGALPPAEHARFESHASRCKGCGAYLEQLAETIRLLGELEPEDLSPDAELQLLDAFRDWKVSDARAEDLGQDG
jgi:anti-sigma factor RsiW